MSGMNAEVESNEEELGGSSDDVRGAIQEAMREVSERARDEQGRFSKGADAADQQPAEGSAPAAAAPAAAGQPQDQSGNGQSEEGAAPAVAAPAAESQAVRPPDSWTPAAKAKFATLDPEIQAEVMRREAEVHKGFTKQDEQRALGKTFSDVVAPYLPMIRAEGGQPIEAVQMLLQTAHNLRHAAPDQKQNMIIQLAQQYGVDMQGVFNRLAGGQQQQVDPQVAELRQQIAQLQQASQQSRHSAEEAAQAQLNTEIESFASDPKNIYFANVRPAMAALIRDGVATGLQEAYDMACWARPDIRPLLLQQTEQQKQAAARDKAQKARAAGGSISGSPTGIAGVVPPADRSLAEELRANLREVMGRN